MVMIRLIIHSPRQTIRHIRWQGQQPAGVGMVHFGLDGWERSF